MDPPCTSSSPALLPPEENATHLSGQALLQSRSAAALRLHYTRLAGFSERLTLCFLLFLGLLLAWLIGHFQASPALLVLLAVAALALGKGRWQQVVEGAELEAELKVRKQQQTQIRGETVEWLNFLINRWSLLTYCKIRRVLHSKVILRVVFSSSTSACRWATCNKTVLEFAKEYVEPLVADLLPPGIGWFIRVNVLSARHFLHWQITWK